MVRIIIYFIFFFLTFSFYFIKAENLNIEEKMYFNFIDLNNDKLISFEEINKSIKLIFQLIDINQDGKISQEEIIELKYIIESLK